jgi:hypothetical protein
LGKARDNQTVDFIPLHQYVKPKLNWYQNFFKVYKNLIYRLLSLPAFGADGCFKMDAGIVFTFYFASAALTVKFDDSFG